MSQVSRALGVLVFALLLAVPAREPDPGLGKVEDQVLEETAGGKIATFWVFLREGTDLSGAARGDWQARGRAVHEKLQQSTAASQGAILELLRSRGVPHHAFWAANRVQVTAGRDLVIELARRPEVSRVIADRSYRTQPAEVAPGASPAPFVAPESQSAGCACRRVTRS